MGVKKVFFVVERQRLHRKVDLIEPTAAEKCSESNSCMIRVMKQQQQQQQQQQHIQQQQQQRKATTAATGTTTAATKST